MKLLNSLEINLDSVKNGLRLYIDPISENSLFDAEESALENNEARFQLIEGCYYDYQINDENFILGDIGENIIQQHKRKQNLGTIAPNIFVGTLSIPILARVSLQQCHTIDLEVQSVKSDYREDYRDMLEFITEKCADLLLKTDAPASQNIEIDYLKDSQTLYQKFAFIKSVLSTDEFAESVHRIITAPATRWSSISESKDIRNARRFSNSNIKDLIRGANRTKLPDNHYLKKYGLETLPKNISSMRKTDSVDTPENRFIKYALETFLKFCTDIRDKAYKFGHKKTKNESELLIRELESQLHHSFFKEISRPATLKLNSPVLQRKEGYREVLRVWLMFDLAAKLIWTGGDDIYKGGKKDIATLYEYWLFFKLLDLLQTIFKVDSKDITDLIKETADGMNLQIKQGKFTALRGVYDSGSRKINIRFNYNRSFSGKKTYPEAGSWTTTLRPDYTLSFWPLGIDEQEAEQQELIIHVHFDAKYKVGNLINFLDQDASKDLDDEKTEGRKGIYKNADLLKMHAYKDAIRRTGGAYILYPGEKSINQKGFHELIPGLGAFPVKPSKKDGGIGELKAFILEVTNHLINRASQREKVAFRIYDIYKNPPELKDEIREPLPEAYNSNRDLIPDDTFVLVAFYDSKTQHDWIRKNKLYNFRMSSRTGSLILDKETVSAKYLLLHTHGEASSGDFWKIVSKGPRVFSRQELIKKGYKSPSQDNYLVIQLEEITDPEFSNAKWAFKKLKNYSSGRASAVPFTTNLTELMKNKV